MIVLENINKTYHNGAPLHVLKGIDLEIGKGELVSIMGASGSGKSTLLNILGILDDYDTGEYFLNGRLIKHLSETQAAAARNNMIGYIFQSFNLINYKNAVENVALPLYYQGVSRRKRNAEALEYLDRLGLRDWAHHMPNEMSGGQKQRVGIARALASDPKVLLCDEATSALDPQTTESILELLRDINKRLHITIVMITHQMNVVKEICDHVAVIEGGRIIEEGPLYEVFTNPKNPTTKEFVASTRTDIVPELVKKLDLHKEYTSGDKALVRLHFLGDSAGEPVITVLIKKYDIDVNILSGNVETLQDTPYGTLLIGMDGDEAHLKEALSYLEGQKLQIEVIGYVK